MGILNIRQSLVIVMIKREMTKHQWVNGSIFTVIVLPWQASSHEDEFEH